MNYIQHLLNQPNFNLKKQLQQIEIDLIKTALLQTGCNQMKSSQLLGIGRGVLNDRITKYKIDLTELYASYKFINLQNMKRLLKDYNEPLTEK